MSFSNPGPLGLAQSRALWTRIFTSLIAGGGLLRLLSAEFSDRRAERDDDAFNAWLKEITGLAGLKV